MSRAIEQATADVTRSPRDNLVLLGIFLVLCLVALVAYGYHQLRLTLEQRQAAVALTGGDPDRGAAAIGSHGCGGCHIIPGVANANGLVGPELGDVGRRVYVAGVVTNTPEHLIAFILNPKAIDPLSAMPITGVDADEARDIAAYLYAIPD